MDLEKFRSLARGWGKIATAGEVISLLCAPEKREGELIRA